MPPWRVCLRCGGRMRGRPSYHEYCSANCWEGGKTDPLIDNYDYDEADLDMGNGWESEDF